MERTFPRGGTKPKKKVTVNANFAIFKNKKTTKKSTRATKKKSSKGPKNSRKKVVKAKASLIDDLKARDVRPDMSILGVVDIISDLEVQMSLPGCLRGIVSAVNISTPYTAMIKDQREQIPTLSEIFEIGQMLPLSILDKSERSANQFIASLNPKDVNKKISIDMLQNGLTLAAAVVSAEEYGVVVDLGIPSVSAFMKKKNVVPGTNYIEGQPLLVVITAVQSSRAIEVADKRAIKGLSQVAPLMPLACLCPGLKSQLIVTSNKKTALEVGVQVCGDKVTAYLHENHLPDLFDETKNYLEGTQLEGTLLYVLPIINHLYFKVTTQQQPSWSLPFGALVKNVEVICVKHSGIIGKIQVKNGFEKCFIPLSRINEYNEIKAGTTSLKRIFTDVKTLPKVRIEWPFRFNRCYFGAIDRASLKQKLYRKDDLKVGQVLDCKVGTVGQKYCTVEISRTLKGFISNDHLTETPMITIPKQIKPGKQVTARVLSLGEKGNLAKLTLKPSLVKTERVLTHGTEVQPGQAYPGFILRVLDSKIVIEFFGGRVAVVTRERLPVSHHTQLSLVYSVGQVVNCYIVRNDADLTLSLIYNKNIPEKLTVGHSYNATVKNADDKGLYLDIEIGSMETWPGYLPKRLMSGNMGVADQLTLLHPVGSTMEVYCAFLDPTRNQQCILSSHPVLTRFYKKERKALRKGKDLLKVGAVIPFIVVCDSKGQSLVPAVPYSCPLAQQPIKDPVSYDSYQLLLGKVISLSREEFTCVTSVRKLWDHNYMSSLQLLAGLLNECHNLQIKINSSTSPLSGVELGAVVKATAIQVMNSNTILKLRSNRSTLAKCSSIIEPNTKVVCRVIWIDYSEEVVWLQVLHENGGSKKQLEKRRNVRAHVVHVCKDVVVADAATSHELVFIPTLRHENDIETIVNSAYKLGEKTKLSIYRFGSKLLGLDKKIVKKIEKRNAMIQCKEIVNSSSKKEELSGTKEEESRESSAKAISLNRETDVEIEFVNVRESSAEQAQEVKQEVFSDEEIVSIPPTPNFESDSDSDAEIKMECDSRDGMEAVTSMKRSSNSDESEEDDLPKNDEIMNLNIGFDWSAANNPKMLSGALSRSLAEQSSSDDEPEESEGTEKKKRKRLSGVEKREKAREAERLLREREERLMDHTKPAESADDFDRLVVSTPDDSAIWLKYMAYHLENTEIEKARAVAKRALKIISFREEQEKLNVWFALLNLEQLYGSLESQKQALEEALRCNEPYKIHVHQLNVLVDAGAGLEAEKLGNAMLKKYSDNEAVWCEVGGALFRLGKLDYSRNVLQRAMSSLPNSKHVALITRFAQLENKYGSSERAQTLYEHILNAFPKRVDVWSAYVDLMVKSGRIDLARQILERSVSQSLPSKKMKVLFKKFIGFEEKHGTKDDVEKIQMAAAEYVEALGGDTDD